MDLEETTSIINPKPTVDPRGLSQSDRLWPSVLRLRVWIQIKTQVLASATGIVRQAQDVNQDSPRTKKRGKRGGKRTSGYEGLRLNMTKSECLSRKYFRICSWNCASVSRWGAVLERLAYAFDVLCLQLGNKNTPRKATRTEWFPGRPESRHSRNGDYIPQGSTKHSLHSRPKPVVQQYSATSWYSFVFVYKHLTKYTTAWSWWTRTYTQALYLLRRAGTCLEK